MELSWVVQQTPHWLVSSMDLWSRVSSAYDTSTYSLSMDSITKYPFIYLIHILSLQYINQSWHIYNNQVLEHILVGFSFYAGMRLSNDPKH